TIPVSALDTEIAVAAHSKSKNVWYDRTLLFHSSGIEKLNHSTEPEQPGDGTTGKPDDTTTEPNVPEVKPGTDTRPDTESRYESDLEGSTRRVNNTTKLADGVYTPDKFSWSGGTGRVTISCNKVTVTNGQAYATIVFSSGSYSYVKASGNIYYASHSGDTSSFVIPVELNKNNRVIGMTTKMSASHEVAYNIFIYLAADGAEDNTDSSLNLKLDEKAPTIPGLEYKEAEELAHAEYFRIYHYEQSITLLEIDMTTDTARTAETEASAKKEKPADEEEETAALYGKNVVKYLIVPEDVEIPAGLEKEMIVVQKPADKAYIASDAVLEILDELHMTEVAAAVGCEAEDCQIESISKALEEEKVSFAGTYMEPDYKELLSKECNLAVMPSEILPQEEKEDTEAEEEQLERLLDTAEHLSLLKIPMLVDRSADEKTELAQYEWIKVYGVLFGCEEQAEKLLDAAFQAAEK
ncbi:MAG TPA: hypothetical protein DCZ20_01415, partial [Lachnospiraceae bacterium]|nr:hypothetical protein [Lachnospiraceae bacterium]